MSIPVSQFIFPDGASGKESACQCRSCRKQVRSLGWGDPLGEEIATSPVFLLENPMDRGAWCYSPWGRKNQTSLSDQTGATSFFLPFGFHELKITFPKFPPNFALALLSEATQMMAFVSLRMTLSHPHAVVSTWQLCCF